MKTRVKVSLLVILASLILITLYLRNSASLSAPLGIPIVQSWTDIILIIEFAVPIMLEVHSRFFSGPDLDLSAFEVKKNQTLIHYTGGKKIQGDIIQAVVANNGKLAQHVMGAINVIGLTDHTETLPWLYNSPGNIYSTYHECILPQLGKYQSREINIAQRPYEDTPERGARPNMQANVWYLETEEIKRPLATYRLENNRRYQGFFVLFFDSSRKLWSITIDIDKDGNARTEKKPMPRFGSRPIFRRMDKEKKAQNDEPAPNVLKQNKT